MENNKKYLKAKSTRKDKKEIEKNNNISQKNKNSKLKNLLFDKKINKSNSNNHMKAHFEKEYNKLENLCNKKSNRDKKEIHNFISEQKMKLIKDNKQKKLKNLNTYQKMFDNYRKLEKEIKNINITNKLKKSEKKQNKIFFSFNNNINDISNGSIENNKLNNNYYFGCLDVKKILSKKIKK